MQFLEQIDVMPGEVVDAGASSESLGAIESGMRGKNQREMLGEFRVEARPFRFAPGTVQIEQRGALPSPCHLGFTTGNLQVMCFGFT